MSSDETRAAIVAEARSWLGTPFHHRARVKGAGVDCANLLLAVYRAAGLIPEVTLERYPPDWHLHSDDQRFMENLLKYADPTETPLPGDIAMFRYGRQPAHGAIVMGWPAVCHAWKDAGRVVLSDVCGGALEQRLSGFYRLKGL